MLSLSKTSDKTAVFVAPALPRVNLLPPEIGERRRFRKVQAGLAGAVVAAAVVVGLLFVIATGGVTDANDEVDSAASQQRAVQAETARYKDVTAAFKRTSDAQLLLATAMGQEVRYSRFLNDLALTIPPNVWIKNLAFTQAAPAAATGVAAAPSGIGTVTITGVAYEHEDVAVWLESLAAQKGYAQPLLQSSTEALLGTSKVVTNWSTTVTLSADALALRYTTTSGG